MGDGKRRLEGQAIEPTNLLDSLIRGGEAGSHIIK